jgi:thermitase
MTPIMSDAANTLALGYIADLNDSSKGSRPEVPILSPESQRWDLAQIEAPEAWPMIPGGRDVVIAVLDTGIDDKHKDLKGKVVGRTSFVTSPSLDVRGHGTHIAGIIAGASDSGSFSGLAYNASLLDVKVAEDDGVTNAYKVAQGIKWAVDHGAKVINISIVIRHPYPQLEEAVNYAWEKDCIVVAAAGNSGISGPVYPAAYPHVIGVAATDKNDRLTEWSNRGAWVSLAAPGVDIYSSLPDGKYGFKSGTSFSTALVSGELALLYAKTVDQNGNSRINDEIEDTVLNNCDTPDVTNAPEKRINVYKAAAYACAASGNLTSD